MPLLEDKLQAEGADYSKGSASAGPFSFQKHQRRLEGVFFLACGQQPSRGHNVSEIDLSAPEVQAAIKAAVKEATQPLIDKRDELLGEVKKLRKGKEIDPADVEKLESELETLRESNKQLQKDAKTAAGAAERATKALEAAEANTSKLLVDNGLTDALVKAGVTNPVHQKAAKAMLAGQVQIADDNGAKVPKLGDKALAEAITEWASGDEGKHFVTAADTNGGGAHNSGHKPTPPQGDMGGDKAARLARAAELLRQNAE